MQDNVETEIVSSIKNLDPLSIFLYGSRGRGDYVAQSDYEVGVVFEEESAMTIAELQNRVHNELVSVYAFNVNDLRSGKVATPFQSTLFLRELVEGSRTIYGQSVVESLATPEITNFDLIQRVSFDKGLALASLLSSRSGDKKTSSEEFSKSCLYALRSFEILELGVFPVGYDQIYEKRKSVDIDAFIRAIDTAYRIRGSELEIGVELIYENIMFIEYVEEKILEHYAKNGQVVLV